MSNWSIWRPGAFRLMEPPKNCQLLIWSYIWCSYIPISTVAHTSICMNVKSIIYSSIAAALCWCAVAVGNPLLVKATLFHIYLFQLLEPPLTQPRAAKCWWSWLARLITKSNEHIFWPEIEDVGCTTYSYIATNASTSQLPRALNASCRVAAYQVVYDLRWFSQVEFSIFSANWKFCERRRRKIIKSMKWFSKWNEWMNVSL